MQAWEYLEVLVSPASSRWEDSTGHVRHLVVEGAGASQWATMTPLLNELGAEGWELAAARAVARGRHRLVFKRPWRGRPTG